MDWSSSEDSNATYIPGAVRDFVDHLDLGQSAVKIGLVPFDVDPLPHGCLPPTSDRRLLDAALSSLERTRPDGWTSFASAFLRADAYFDASEAERGAPALRVFIFISDGNEYGSRQLTVTLADRMKSEGTAVWCLATPNAFRSGPDAERDHMERISSGPGYFLQEYYAGLREELMRLNLCP